MPRRPRPSYNRIQLIPACISGQSGQSARKRSTIKSERQFCMDAGLPSSADTATHATIVLKTHCLLELISLDRAPFLNSSRLLSGSPTHFRGPTCSTLLQPSTPLVRVAGLAGLLERAAPPRSSSQGRRTEHISTAVCRWSRVAGEIITWLSGSPTPRHGWHDQHSAG
jgi:hypothetical protein